MTQFDNKVKDFFNHYERANANFDVQAIGRLYADDFMFADPQGVRAIKKSDFLNVLPRRKEYFRSLGLVSSTVQSVTASELDAKYLLAKLVWKFRFEPEGKEPIESENLGTYILAAVGDSFQIVFQLDHQDLTQKAQELGLK